MDDHRNPPTTVDVSWAGEVPLTIAEFAALHRVVPLTVRRWIRDEGLPVHQRRKGTKILIYPSEVRAWSLEVWGHEFKCIGAPPGRTVAPPEPATLSDAAEEGTA